MEVYSGCCTQCIVNKNKTQYKQANLTTVIQATMFERGKSDVNTFCVNLPWKLWFSILNVKSNKLIYDWIGSQPLEQSQKNIIFT